jgi:hypothetical protein
VPLLSIRLDERLIGGRLPVENFSVNKTIDSIGQKWDLSNV